MKYIPIESLYAALDSIEKSVVKEERGYRMILIELIEARRNLWYKCKELFTDEKIAEQIYRYLCEGLEECEDKKHAYFFQGWAWNNSNIAQHTECVETALDALDASQRAYEQGVKDTLDKYDETCRIVSEIRMAVGCKTVKECLELIRNDEIQRVKHGKWIINERGVYECSVCGRVPTQEQKLYDQYCPNCGAKMSEDEDIPMEYFENGGI